MKKLFTKIHGTNPLQITKPGATVKRLKRSRAGFTIIELLIATGVFSVVLLVVTTAMLQIGRVYHKGISGVRTQEAARTIIDEVSRAIQFTGGTFTVITPNGDSAGFCIGERRYSYVTGRRLVDGSALTATRSPHVLVVEDKVAGCASQSAQNITTNSAPVAGRELMSPNMQLHTFAVTPPLDGGLYAVHVRVIYGDNEDGELINATTGQCNAGAGSQFCAAAELNTVVKKRVE